MKQIVKQPSLFTKNRKRFVAHMKPNSIAIIHSNENITSNGDTLYPFEQNSDLFWLTGIQQEKTFLVLFPSNKEQQYTEALFIMEASELMVKWEGKKLSKTLAKEISGIKQICWTSDFYTLIQRWMHQAEHVYLDSNENDRKANVDIFSQDYHFINQFKQKYPLHHYHRAATIFKQLRAIKLEQEITLLQKAIDITHNTFLDILQFVKPNIKENEIEALIYHSFIKQGSVGPGYLPIVASGDNARILHYIDNNNFCKDGDLILMDFGAKYGGYNADLSRTIPVNGKFTKRQKEIYDACLQLHEYAKSILKPGISIVDYHEKVGIEANIVFEKIGLITQSDIKNEAKENPAYRKYLYHGISHFLGIDVHDLGSYTEKIQEGMVFTIEPGIYVEEEQIGIRIENNVVLTENGNKDLMSKIPITTDEIEALMKEK